MDLHVFPILIPAMRQVPGAGALGRPRGIGWRESCFNKEPVAAIATLIYSEQH